MAHKRKRSISELCASPSSVSSFDSPPRVSNSITNPFTIMTSTPLHLHSRTMKRVRDNRPSAETIHRKLHPFWLVWVCTCWPGYRTHTQYAVLGTEPESRRRDSIWTYANRDKNYTTRVNTTISPSILEHFFRTLSVNFYSQPNRTHSFELRRLWC